MITLCFFLVVGGFTGKACEQVPSVQAWAASDECKKLKVITCNPYLVSHTADVVDTIQLYFRFGT